MTSAAPLATADLPRSTVLESVPSGQPQRQIAAVYDAVAADYTRLVGDELDGKPLDRALLTAFSELVDVEFPILDLGCGPGRIAAFLHALGCTVIGFDLSRDMIAEARNAHPDLAFSVGSISAVPVEDASVGGVVAWYSIIHTATEDLPRVFSEFRRVLRPGGIVLLAFQTGDAVTRLERGYGHDIDLLLWRRPLSLVAEFLQRSGFEIVASLDRSPEVPELTHRGHLIARAV